MDNTPTSSTAHFSSLPTSNLTQYLKSRSLLRLSSVLSFLTTSGLIKLFSAIPFATLSCDNLSQILRWWGNPNQFHPRHSIASKLYSIMKTINIWDVNQSSRRDPLPNRESDLCLQVRRSSASTSVIGLVVKFIVAIPPGNKIRWALGSIPRLRIQFSLFASPRDVFCICWCWSVWW